MTAPRLPPAWLSQLPRHSFATVSHQGLFGPQQEYVKLEDVCAAVQAREQDLVNLVNLWTQAANGGYEAERTSRTDHGDLELAAYELGKADARRFCAEVLGLLLGAGSGAAPQP